MFMVAEHRHSILKAVSIELPMVESTESPEKSRQKRKVSAYHHPVIL